MKKTLEELQKETIATFKEYEKTRRRPWTYRIAAFDLSYQVGSLAKRILQIEGDRFGENLSREELKTKTADELVDIMAEVVFIAHELGIDLEQAWQNMLESDKKKVSEQSQQHG